MIDSLRARYPHLGLSVYALIPGGDVTVEALTPDGSVFSKQASTEREAFILLFGPDAETEIPQEEPLHVADEPDDIFS